MVSTFARRCGCALLLAAAPMLAHAQPEPTVNPLAFSLYAELAQADGNLFFSPFSIATALAMAAEGARGETAQQMAKVLGGGACGSDARCDFTALHAGLGELATRLAPKPTPAATLQRIATLRAELDRANASLEKATSYGDEYRKLGERAEALATEINGLQKLVNPYELRTANAVWVEQTFTLEPPWLATIARDYGTDGALAVDFRGDPEAARGTINAWVGKRTNARIPELLAPGTVDTRTRLVLTNAVWFLGEWLEPFQPERTKDEPFRLRDGSSVATPLMHGRQSERVRYAAFNADGSPFATPARIEAGEWNSPANYPARGFQLVELPYKGDALSMLVLLPATPDGLASVEAMLSSERVAQWTAALETRAVDVVLPKFRLESSFELSDALKALGMPRAFVDTADPDGAQFDGISTGSEPTQRLFIGAVVHKAFVEVSEKGTEAAAATAVIMAVGAAMPTMVDFTPTFRADRPFVFLIRDNASGAVLFLGRLQRPERVVSASSP